MQDGKRAIRFLHPITNSFQLTENRTVGVTEDVFICEEGCIKILICTLASNIAEKGLFLASARNVARPYRVGNFNIC